MQQRREVTAIEVAPGALLGMVIDSQLARAFRARELDPLLVLCVDINPLLFDRQIDPGDGPGRFETEQVTVEICILHPPRLHRRVASRRGPTEIPEGSRKERR